MSSFRPEWLIDVVRGCVVPCDERTSRFLTLSYTWGRTKNFRTLKSNLGAVRQPGALFSGPIASEVPLTIRNAIRLTKALGETRLWVDSLCIVQDDSLALAHDLRHMHRIFASSFLTIIAKDGQDAGYGLRGLRGISPPRATKQHVVPLAGGERLATMNNSEPGKEPEVYDYDQRMWTFQEKMFAKRQLIFANGSVIWQCNCVQWSEHVTSHAEADRRGQMMQDEELSMSVPSLSLNSLVVDFNRRNLTFDGDVSAAFSGISTYLERRFPRAPEFFFDISLLWHWSGRLRRRRTLGESSEEPMTTGPPSWSWMGWQGATYFHHDLEYEYLPLGDTGFTAPLTEWFILESPSAVRRQIDSRWHQYKTASPSRLLEGWKAMEFVPPPTLDAFNCTNNEIKPEFTPRHIPKIFYAHASEHQRQKKFWYQVPTVDVGILQSHRPEPHRQFQYICCKTSRAFIKASYDADWESCRNEYVSYLQDDSGATVGILKLSHSVDVASQQEAKVELVAIVKGWSSLMDKYSEERKTRASWNSSREDIQLTAEEEEAERKLMAFSEGVRRKSWQEEWDIHDKLKLDCCFVLWVEWKDGVAYRKGSGMVLADRWDELKEAEEVELILG
ncbi:heterokaryon incompatibility protein [Colletotrichum higginsianum]|nr:heterokaryon incompatibility protein [Colletotrichum higginsianum]